MKKYLSGLKGGGRVPLRGMEVVKNLKWKKKLLKKIVSMKKYLSDLKFE